MWKLWHPFGPRYYLGLTPDVKAQAFDAVVIQKLEVAYDKIMDYGKSYRDKNTQLGGISLNLESLTEVDQAIDEAIKALENSSKSKKEKSS